VPPAFAVSALAVAAERANAIGAVRLTCDGEGLEIELARVAPHQSGFAPAAVVEEVAFRVPYRAVRALVRHGKTLILAIDPAAAAPYNRFALVRFTDDPPEALLAAHSARLRASTASWLVPLPLGLALAAALPAAWIGGPLGFAAVTAVVAVVAWRALRELHAWLSWGGPVSDGYRNAFEARVAHHLGLQPVVIERMPMHEPLPIDAALRANAASNAAAAAAQRAATMASAPPPSVAPHSAPPASVAPHSAPPRSAPRLAPPALPLPPISPDEAGEPNRDRGVRALLAIAACTVIGIGGMGWLLRYGWRDPIPAETARSQLAPPVSSAARTELLPGASKLTRCVCARADSPLWNDGVPALSVMPSSRRGKGSDVAPEADAKGKPRYDFDLAVVNNGAEPLVDVRVVATFARRDEQGERTGVKERGLFWEGELAPGRAVKWRVRAPGTEMRIDSEVGGKLGDGLEPAPADAFWKLVESARYRVVRLHAASMLAYLGDPRAMEALDRIGPPVGAAEERTVARIRRAISSTKVCDLGKSETACVFNGSTTERGSLELLEIADDGSNGRTWQVDETVPVHEGLIVPLPLEGKPPPREILVRAR
jgi:hypothetical protein